MTENLLNRSAGRLCPPARPFAGAAKPAAAPFDVGGGGRRPVTPPFVSQMAKPTGIVTLRSTGQIPTIRPALPVSQPNGMSVTAAREAAVSVEPTALLGASPAFAPVDEFGPAEGLISVPVELSVIADSLEDIDVQSPDSEPRIEEWIEHSADHFPSVDADPVGSDAELSAECTERDSHAEVDSYGDGIETAAGAGVSAAMQSGANDVGARSWEGANATSAADSDDWFGGSADFSAPLPEPAIDETSRTGRADLEDKSLSRPEQADVELNSLGSESVETGAEYEVPHDDMNVGGADVGIAVRTETSDASAELGEGPAAPDIPEGTVDGDARFMFRTDVTTPLSCEAVGQATSATDAGDSADDGWRAPSITTLTLGSTKHVSTDAECNVELEESTGSAPHNSDLVSVFCEDGIEAEVVEVILEGEMRSDELATLEPISRISAILPTSDEDPARQRIAETLERLAMRIRNGDIPLGHSANVGSETAVLASVLSTLLSEAP